MLFRPPQLDSTDHRVIAEIDAMRDELRHVLREPRRWEGVLRRSLKARAIRGSNSIEGYLVTLGDASAAVEQEAPLETDARTWLEIVGYRTALTYVQQLARDEHFSYSEGLLKSLHYMLLGHDLSKSPGLFRHREIFVEDERTGRIVYEGPDSEQVQPLITEMLTGLDAQDDKSAYVRAAMAHLNLVMIHPFRDGNGRMARCLQTLVLARDGILSPEFSSVEEYLGENTVSYYAVLAETGAGAWRPERNTGSWVRFSLRAHHVQAQTVRRRVFEAAEMFRRLDELAEQSGLHERVSSALYDAAIGLAVRRSRYAKDAGLKDGTATGDLRALVTLGLLTPRGETKGRTYTAASKLLELRREVRGSLPSRPVDPYADHPAEQIPGQGQLFP
jgi:Fic family protein